MPAHCQAQRAQKCKEGHWGFSFKYRMGTPNNFAGGLPWLSSAKFFTEQPAAQGLHVLFAAQDLMRRSRFRKSQCTATRLPSLSAKAGKEWMSIQIPILRQAFALYCAMPFATTLQSAHPTSPRPDQSVMTYPAAGSGFPYNDGRSDGEKYQSRW